MRHAINDLNSKEFGYYGNNHQRFCGMRETSGFIYSNLLNHRYFYKLMSAYFFPLLNLIN